MLSTGTKSLDHLLTIGQSPSTNRGLGFQGSTSKSGEVGQEVKFAKEASKEERSKEPQSLHTQTTIRKTEEENAVRSRRRGNGCHFCGRRGHHVRFCYFQRN